MGLPRLVGDDLGSGGGRVLAAPVRRRLRGPRASDRRRMPRAAAPPARRWKRGCGRPGRRSRLGRRARARSESWSAPGRGLESDPAASQLESGPESSGVYARFEASGGGEDAGRPRPEGRAGAGASGPRRASSRRPGTAAGPRPGSSPGSTLRGVAAAAADLLDEASLRDHYAVATEGGEEAPLPLGS